MEKCLRRSMLHVLVFLKQNIGRFQPIFSCSHHTEGERECARTRRRDRSGCADASRHVGGVVYDPTVSCAVPFERGCVSVLVRSARNKAKSIELAGGSCCEYRNAICEKIV